MFMELLAFKALCHEHSHSVTRVIHKVGVENLIFSGTRVTTLQTTSQIEPANRQGLSIFFHMLS